jgi:hypothetical protein
LEKSTGASGGGRGVGLVVVMMVAAVAGAVMVRPEMDPGVDGEREEGRIGETVSDVPIFARSECCGELFGKGGTCPSTEALQ